jgi:cell division septum initiation protein DivIVA
MQASETDVIRALLHQLESEERALSRRRQKLHARIATFTDSTGSWAAEERELSNKRRALHRQIDQLLKDTSENSHVGRRTPDPLRASRPSS